MTRIRVEVWVLVNMVLEDLMDTPKTEARTEGEPWAEPATSEETMNQPILVNAQG